jgi:toxin-antitoxin system PIN domain toxin
VILPDVNILIYAFRQDSVRHDECRGWLDDVVNGAEPFGISPQTLAALIRITTNPRIYPDASSAAEGFAFSAALLNADQCMPILAGPRHWAIFEDLCRTLNATGNLVQDAWFAALAIEAGCEWITTDRDYSRFPGLRWRTPF